MYYSRESNLMTGLPRYLTIGCMALAGVLTLFLYHWVTEGRWMLKSHARVLELSAQFLPMPFAYLAWVYLMERKEKFTLNFSPVFCILSLECFMLVQAVRWLPMAAPYALAAGMVAGFFVLVPFRDALKRVVADPRPAFVAAFAGSAAMAYYALLKVTWEYMCGATSQMVYWLTKLFGYDVHVSIHHAIDKSVVTIASPHFSILVFPDCSGLEGIFLFSFMMSLMLLLDWDLFKHKSLRLLYICGACYMFCINALRIFLFFSLGYFSYQPGAPDWLKSFRGKPIELFHSYEGWLIYLVAFGIFALWMYKTIPDRQPAVSS